MTIADFLSWPFQKNYVSDFLKTSELNLTEVGDHVQGPHWLKHNLVRDYPSSIRSGYWEKTLLNILWLQLEDYIYDPVQICIIYGRMFFYFDHKH